MKTNRQSRWTAEQHRRYAETLLTRAPAIVLAIAVLVAAARGSEAAAIASGAATAIQHFWVRLACGK